MYSQADIHNKYCTIHLLNIISTLTSDILFYLSTDYEILYMNKMAENVFAVSSQEVLGKSFLVLCAEKQCNFLPDIYRDSILERGEIFTEISLNVGDIELKWTIAPLNQDNTEYQDGFLLIGSGYHEFVLKNQIKTSLLGVFNHEADSSQGLKNHARNLFSTQENIANNAAVTTKKRYTAKALVVEDHPMIQKSFKINLNKLNCAVDIVQSGEQALELVEKNYYDIILMDIGLPGIDGLETTKQIRKLEDKQNKEHVPIIMQTADTGFYVENECLAVGVNAILQKPVMFKALELALKKYVQQKEVKQDLSLLNKTDIPSHQQKSIDLNAAITIGGSHEHAEQFLKEVAKALVKERAEIDAAYKKEDWETLHFVVHRLHGTLCYTGAPILKSIVKEMEIMLDNDDFQVFPTLYENFLRECDIFLEAFHQMFPEE